MTGGYNLRKLLLASGALIATWGASDEAKAQAFGISGQSSYFSGMANAGAAAGVDISSMYWNPAAAAAQPGLNTSSSYYGIFVRAPEHATGGSLTELGLPNSADVGQNGIATMSYLNYQYTDRIYLGLALSVPYGLITKPDHEWAGSPINTSTRIFSVNAEPVIAYKLTPEITIGAGAQIQYFQAKFNNDGLSVDGQPLIGKRHFEGDNVGGGGAVGILWDPMPGTTLGLGYRSQVDVSPSGDYDRAAGAFTGFPVATDGTASLTLPDQVTASFRQIATQQITLLGTVLWQDWSQLKNVNTTSPASGCVGNICETLNLNYRNSWYFSLGAEYAYDERWTLRAGGGYLISPVTDSNREISLPDANRVQLSIGASYKWSDKILLNASYEHLFIDNGSFCMSNPAITNTQHCAPGVPAGAIAIEGYAKPSADVVSVGLNYKLSGSAPLESYK